MKCAGDDKENQGGKHSVYTGETTRCQHLRGAEHLSRLLNKQPNNALYKHVTGRACGLQYEGCQEASISPVQAGS